MKYEKDEIVEAWPGGPLGSPYPPPADASWEKARVVEVWEHGAVQVSWLGSRLGMPVMPPAGVRKASS